jgi:hypothetical protein
LNSGFNTQGRNSIAIGVEAGRNTQGERSIAIGYQAGFTGQQNSSIAMGFQAGYTGQGIDTIAVGDQAGYFYQGQNSIAIGYKAGKTNQASNSVSIGTNSNSTLSNQICLGSSFDTVYMSNPVISLTNNKSYLTLPDAGVFMLNGSGGGSGSNYALFPVYVSIPDMTNFFGQTQTGVVLNADANSADGDAKGFYTNQNIQDIDDAYYVFPNYGVTSYDTANYVLGTIYVNFYNNTSSPVMVRPGSSGTAGANRCGSLKIYYQGTQLTSY